MNKNNYENKYEECEKLLSEFGLDIGDLEDYTIENGAKLGKIFTYSLVTITSIINILIGLGSGVFDIGFAVTMLIAIYLVSAISIKFSMKHVLPIVIPYKRSDIKNSLYFLDKNLRTSKERTLKYLKKVAKYKLNK